MTKVKIEKESTIKLPDTKYCDRCGNDFLKGKFMFHFPYKKLYVSLCHICYGGLAYGLFADVSRDIKELRKNE